MRWLVVGAAGMLGQDLLTVLAREGEHVEGIDRQHVDISRPSSVFAAVRGADVVVNCAAFTAVDAAEADEALAFAVNAVGAAHVARASREQGARLVHISTDYVFDGTASTPYSADAPIAPQSAYGRTKAAGEWAVRAEAPDHLLVRTAWLYGAHGACFPRTIARAARERGALEVVEDQVGQPTWTVDVARLILQMVRAEIPTGTYHATSTGLVSWHGFARAVVEAAGMDPAMVRPTTGQAARRPARRPAYSALGHDELTTAGITPIGNWADRWAIAATEVLYG